MIRKSIHPRRLLAGILSFTVLGGSGWLLANRTATADNKPAQAEGYTRNADGHILIAAKSALEKSLQIAAVQPQEVALPLQLPAVVEADPLRFVKIMTPLAGRITSVRKQAGDIVKAGDVLLTIDSADLAQALSDQEKARAALNLSKRQLERQQAMDKADVGTKRDLEQAQSDVAQAQAELSRAEARLGLLGAKAQSAGDILPGHQLVVRAPSAGRVVELNAAPGAYWNDVNQPLMSIADLSKVFVTASAKEKDLALLAEGQSVTIRFDAFAEPVQAKVQYIGDVLDPDTRSVKVRIPLINTDKKLKPGMFAKAELSTGAHQGLLVPATAVVQQGFASKVFVEVAPRELAAREVTVGPVNNGRFEVLSGLKAGERVLLKDGVIFND
ncbi:efflux RND transporter periplasmic adaptor subunit [Undibacterium luofuense]|uniref:Efflux RND transporter periplasmic adaptor subunit n=1 Tax=Undibacterium luofuense TaxID=2828733 RepID=A0A941I673_9BURK|nr:efflux RND transporter periplasmic adaptor subunit [Undibacterium luofuense]MBR7783567.1 efflux RND transporter periplasmic adaptor subunit [Undibacterium luofuense]